MKKLFLVFLLTPGLFIIRAQSRPDRLLWYNRPAKYFTESLILGNGKMGASVYGGVPEDHIDLNDITFWTGEPVDPRMNPEAHKVIPEIRNALWTENYPRADSLQRKVQGTFSQSYAPLGELRLTMPAGSYSEYRRTLDISTAVATVTYESEGVRYRREYFVSHPDQVLAIRITADKPGALNGSIGFGSLMRYKTSITGNTLRIEGYAPWHAEPNYRRNLPEPVRFDPARGTRFSTDVRVVNRDGEISGSDTVLHFLHCSEVVILAAIETSFNGFDNNPATEGKDNRALAENILTQAAGKSWDELLERHKEDYASFFDRVDLQLDRSAPPDLPTDERLQRYSNGAADLNLEELYYQFGRYLLISSSRTPGVPANLQGLWNKWLRPPWSSNYTMNINLEENYWPAETANLTEMHRPLLGFIGNLATTGSITAQTFLGTRGWAACHNSDIWAMSNPVGDFGHGHPVWANWYMGGTWLSTHLWEHYLFTLDTSWLTDYAWPLMQGAARFCLDWLVPGPEGYLITAPSTSPENLYKTPAGYTGATLYGGTADLAMIRELFRDVLAAAEVLGRRDAFADSVSLALSRLRPYRVGKKGNLQEWYHDWEDADPQHRHQSHLFGLYPGHQITPASTPHLADACKRSLEIKGDKTTGWSLGWRINLWARLLDGDHAYRLFRNLLHYVPAGDLSTSFGQAGGTYPNLLDAHPPFQIDGNFGGTAGVVEMLLQSSPDTLMLLPALPKAWPAGAVSGLRARGGFEVSMTWKNHQLQQAVIKSVGGRKTILKYQGRVEDITLRPGAEITVSFGQDAVGQSKQEDPGMVEKEILCMPLFSGKTVGSKYTGVLCPHYP